MHDSATQPPAPPDAIIMAAGHGTRMGSDLAKVLHQVAGRPMLWWVVQACREVGVGRCIIVVGYRAQAVRAAMAGEAGCRFVHQAKQLGTGHATQMAQVLFDGQPPCDVFVLAGDGPLVRAATLDRLLQTHRRTGAAATLATAVLERPDGYGRIVRGPDGQFEAIVEHKDADGAQRTIREINPSYYCFRSDLLFDALRRVGRRNRQDEYYLTDVPARLKADGHRVVVVDAVPAEDVLGVNTPDQLAEVDRILRARLGRTDGRTRASP